jgi:hypothetical protein
MLRHVPRQHRSNLPKLPVSGKTCDLKTRVKKGSQTCIQQRENYIPLIFAVHFHQAALRVKVPVTTIVKTKVQKQDQSFRTFPSRENKPYCRKRIAVVTGKVRTSWVLVRMKIIYSYSKAFWFALGSFMGARHVFLIAPT